MPGRKLSFYVDFLKRGRSAFAGLERTEGDALAPCTVTNAGRRSGVSLSSHLLHCLRNLLELFQHVF